MASAGLVVGIEFVDVNVRDCKFFFCIPFDEVTRLRFNDTGN